MNCWPLVISYGGYEVLYSVFTISIMFNKSSGFKSLGGNSSGGGFGNKSTFNSAGGSTFGTSKTFGGSTNQGNLYLFPQAA